MSQTRPEPTSSPVALFVFSNLREQKGGLTRAWLRRLSLFHEAGWQTHVATIHLQPEIDETLVAWRERGWLPQETVVHHYQRRSRRFRASWTRPTDDHFTRDNRVADWLDWLVGLIPGVVVFADSPVTYAPVSMMRNPYVGRIMTVHLAHRTSSRGSAKRKKPARKRSIYQGPAGQPKLTGRFLPFAASADAVVALTHRQAEHLAADVPGLSVQVIPNMVDPVDPTLTMPTRDRLQVVSLGRLDPLKRIDDAMRAVGLARADVPGLHMAVHGRGPDLDRLLDLRDELGLHDAVSFPGFTEDPHEALAGARASLMTSRREGFGLAVAESLAVGTPVVTYDVDYGPAELVHDGGNGRVVPDGAVDQLAAALVDVVTDDETWARMSAAGPPAVAHLATDRVASAWLDLAAKVAAGVPEPGPGLLLEDLRVRRHGVEVHAVAYSADGRRPAHLGLGETANASNLTVALGPTAAVPAQTGSRVGVSVVTATLPTDELARALAALPGSSEGLRLTAQDLQGEPLPALGPGLPATAVPTAAGVGIVRQAGSDGSVELVAARSAVPLQSSTARVAADLDGDITVLSDVVSFAASPIRAAAAQRLNVSCVTPGLDAMTGSKVSLVARTDPARVLGSVELVAQGPATTVTGRWQGVGEVTWDEQALQGLRAGPAVRLDLAVGVGRTHRTVGTIAGPGRPLSIRLAGTPWVMATSSNGRLMLLPGRGVRSRVRWVLRRVGRRDF